MEIRQSQPTDRSRLIEGFAIRKVWDAQWHEQSATVPQPGTPGHTRAFEAYFSVLGQKIE